MSKNNGIHHLAIAAADIKTQIDFFNASGRVSDTALRIEPVRPKYI